MSGVPWGLQQQQTTGVLMFHQPEHVMSFLAHWQLRIQINTKKGGGGRGRLQRFSEGANQVRGP